MYAAEGRAHPFHRADRRATAIANVVHLFGDHIAAGCGAGLSLRELREQLVDAEWIRENQRLFGEPRLANHVGHPVSFAMVWARA